MQASKDTTGATWEATSAAYNSAWTVDNVQRQTAEATRAVAEAYGMTPDDFQGQLRGALQQASVSPCDQALQKFQTCQSALLGALPNCPTVRCGRRSHGPDCLGLRMLHARRPR